MATLAYKYTLAARFLLAELDVGVAPSCATPFYFGAQAALEGATCERLAKKSRWMAMRYAMLRWGIMCGTIEPASAPRPRAHPAASPNASSARTSSAPALASSACPSPRLPLSAETFPTLVAMLVYKLTYNSHPSIAHVPLG